MISTFIVVLYMLMCVGGVALFWDLWEELGELEGWRGDLAQIIMFITGGLWLVQAIIVGIFILLGYDDEDGLF